MSNPDPLREILQEPLRAPQRYFPREEPPEKRGFRWGLWLFVLFLLAMLAPPAIVLPLRWIAPPTTAFMLQSEVRPVQYQWVDAGQIPDTLRLGAVAAEDQKFFTHFGFDLIAIAEALEHNEKSKNKRGASTITQQVAKNLFLWPSRSWLRKGLEVTFTVLIELCWPKDRILEVYLNVAEFGPGIYGVQAAARHFFHKDAADLSPLETSRLVAVLPNPRKWNAGRPGPYVQKRIDWIMAHIGYGPPSEVAPETGEPMLPSEPIPTEPLPAEPGLEPEPGPVTAEPAPEAGPETPPEPPPEEAPAPETGPPTTGTPPPATEPPPAEAQPPPEETVAPEPAPEPTG